MARPIPRLSILAPCFDEERCLAEFYARVTAAAHAAVGTDYEMVLVNDGSYDSTLNIMHALADDDPRLIAVTYPATMGTNVP